MKELWNKKLALRAFYTFLSLAGVILLYFGINYIPDFLSFVGTIVDVIMPFIVGFVIAYLLNPFYKMFKHKVFNKLFKNPKTKESVKKVFAIVTTYAIILGVLAFLLYIVIPQLISSVTELVTNIPAYYTDFIAWLNGIGIVLDDSFITKAFETVIDSLLKFVQSIKLSDLVVIKDITLSITSGVATFFIGLIASVYMLYNKDIFAAQAKKIGFALFSRRFMLRFQRIAGESHITFAKYLSGVVTDAFIVGCLTFIIAAICQVPYATLIGVLIGITNVIPYFGPFIGGIPTALIVLVIDPLKALWLIIILVVVQQLDSNFITPRVVGQKTGLPSMWVMFSIIFFGGLMGIVGMIIAVPLCSLLFSITREIINRKLKKKHLPTQTDAYSKKGISTLIKYRDTNKSENETSEEV